MKFGIFKNEIIENKYGEETKLVCLLVRYTDNDNIALVLFEKETCDNYATASVNDINLKDPFTLIKDYSENEGIYQLLLDHDVIEATNITHRLGYVTVPMAIVKLDNFEELERDSKILKKYLG